jgi:clan AA aspartic protease
VIVGKVERLHPTVPVTFQLSSDLDLTIEFVVDTGFVGFLTLPVVAVAAMGLPFEYDTPANLADDSEVQLPVHGATIFWEGTLRRVRVLATGKRPLLGMSLLHGSSLSIDCTEAGIVRIEPL